MVTAHQTPIEQKGSILELSLTGCQVEVPYLVEKSALVELRIFVPDLEWPIMVDGAVVQRIEGNTLHLYFVRLTAREAERLAWVIGRIAEDGEMEPTSIIGTVAG